MPEIIDIAPVNSLLFIQGSKDWKTPEIEPETGQVWSTSSCVATSCFPEIDGPTKVILGEARDVAVASQPVFDGILQTPDQRVVVVTVGSDEPVLAQPVLTSFTRIRIWHSHPRWPDVVRIGIG